jgi:hypothetical protein
MHQDIAGNAAVILEIRIHDGIMISSGDKWYHYGRKIQVTSGNSLLVLLGKANLWGVHQFRLPRLDFPWMRASSLWCETKRYPQLELWLPRKNAGRFCYMQHNNNEKRHLQQVTWLTGSTTWGDPRLLPSRRHPQVDLRDCCRMSRNLWQYRCERRYSWNWERSGPE